LNALLLKAFFIIQKPTFKHSLGDEIRVGLAVLIPEVGGIKVSIEHFVAQSFFHYTKTHLQA
jgi:hypothetical protein